MLVQCSDRKFYKNPGWATNKDGSGDHVYADGHTLKIWASGDLRPRQLEYRARKLGVPVKVDATTVECVGPMTFAEITLRKPPVPPGTSEAILKSEDGYPGEVVVTVDTKYRERRKALIAALRSGKYKQIRGRLSHGDCFCAEGVACEVYIAAGKRLVKKLVGDYVMYGRSSFVAPAVVRKYFDLPGDLCLMNDSQRLTFAQIADKLEAEWL